MWYRKPTAGAFPNILKALAKARAAKGRMLPVAGTSWARNAFLLMRSVAMENRRSKITTSIAKGLAMAEQGTCFLNTDPWVTVLQIAWTNNVSFRSQTETNPFLSRRKKRCRARRSLSEYGKPRNTPTETVAFAVCQGFATPSLHSPHARLQTSWRPYIGPFLSSQLQNILTEQQRLQEI